MNDRIDHLEVEEIEKAMGTGGVGQMKNNYEQIYRVSFKKPPYEDDARSDFYFTSLAAIYQHFTKEQIGCSVSRLWNLKISGGNTYKSRLCTISRHPLFRMKQNTSQTTGDKSEKNN